MLDQRLSTILKFTEDDLTHNRQGRLSPTQRAAYEPPLVAQIAMWVIVGHFLFLAALFGLIAIVANRPIMWALLLVVLGLAGLPFVASRNEFLARPVLQTDLAKGRVVQVCGTALLQTEDGKTQLLIGGQAFAVSMKLSSAIHHGTDYCLYYLPESRTLLSIEPMETRA